MVSKALKQTLDFLVAGADNIPPLLACSAERSKRMFLFSQVEMSGYSGRKAKYYVN